jgi:DNA-binding LytR/AlgR family response regulator
MQKVFVNQIVYIESCKDYVKIFLATGQNFIARQSISSMENMLSAHSFLRVHRSFLISLEKMTGYNNNDVLIGQTEIPIGRLYKQQVMEVISPG